VSFNSLVVKFSNLLFVYLSDFIYLMLPYGASVCYHLLLRPLGVYPRLNLKVQFKLCLLTYKALHGLAPSYIADLCRPVTTIGSRQRLRSATRGDLVVASSVTNFGTLAFVVAGPKAWNQLPTHIRARESVGSFKMALKSHFHFVDSNMLRRVRNCRRYYYYYY